MAIPFDKESITAGQIRKTLSKGIPLIRTDGIKIPGFCELSKCIMPTITSWAFQLDDFGFEDYEQELHIPLIDLDQMAGDFCILFWASPGKLAMMQFTQKEHRYHDWINYTDSVLGDSISANIFDK